MRQISATIIVPFEFANLAKKIRIIAIVHPKTHATTTQLFHLKTNMIARFCGLQRK